MHGPVVGDTDYSGMLENVTGRPLMKRKVGRKPKVRNNTAGDKLV
jgi:hypothetical protein